MITPTLTKGEIWRIDLDPTKGAEIQKTRPVVIVNSDHVGRLPLRIVVPITDWKPAYANFSWFVHLMPDSQNGLSKESGADAFQVRSVSTTRFIEHLGNLSDPDLERVILALISCYR
jgi:mRNA interferase MazF